MAWRMSQAHARLKAKPPEASFADVRLVLEAYGWRQDRQKGSHVSFSKAGQRSLTLPLASRSMVKRPYVELLLTALRLEE